MAKSKKIKSGNSAKPKNKATKQATGPKRRPLDPAGLAYARLLSDPCNAPLAHPTYSGTEGGYLVRADTFITFGAGAAVTCGLMQWTPGVLTDTNSGLIFSDGPNPAAVQTTVAAGDSSLPGLTFLKNNASAVRCVAACMKLSYPGAESTRSGRIHYGQVSSGLVGLGGNYAPDAFAQALPFFERTPADIIELVWKPNDADQLFMKPNTNASLDNAKNNKSAALAFAFAGFPVATGITVHLTAVYEWQPGYASNLANPNLSKSPSGNTSDDVVNYLISRGFAFVKSNAMSMGRNVLEGILGNVYGIMGANAGSKARQTLIGY